MCTIKRIDCCENKEAVSLIVDSSESNLSIYLYLAQSKHSANSKICWMNPQHSAVSLIVQRQKFRHFIHLLNEQFKVGARPLDRHWEIREIKSSPYLHFQQINRLPQYREKNAIASACHMYHDNVCYVHEGSHLTKQVMAVGTQRGLKE